MNIQHGNKPNCLVLQSGKSASGTFSVRVVVYRGRYSCNVVRFRSLFCSVSFFFPFSNVVKKGVTHVVAKEPGTDKTMTATKLGIYNCSRLWLERSISTFQRCNERDYSFTPLEKLRQSQGFPPAGSGVFLPSVKRVPPPVKIHPRGQGTFVHRAGGDGAEDVGLSMAAWREENSRMLVEKKTEDDYDYDDDDDDDGCIIDSLMSNYL